MSPEGQSRQRLASPKLISGKKKKPRERRSDLLSTPRERERDRQKGQGTASLDIYGARRSARSSSGEGQRAAAEVRGRVG